MTKMAKLCRMFDFIELGFGDLTHFLFEGRSGVDLHDERALETCLFRFFPAPSHISRRYHLSV